MNLVGCFLKLLAPAASCSKEFLQVYSAFHGKVQHLLSIERYDLPFHLMSPRFWGKRSNWWDHLHLALVYIVSKNFKMTLLFIHRLFFLLSLPFTPPSIQEKQPC